MKPEYFFIAFVAFIICGCKQTAEPPHELFVKQWYAGKAELNSYSLEQTRYGEIRRGEAVLIFVTEDFSSDKLVKLDEPEKAGDKVRIMKMNMTKNFVTGIYPYSMMLSVFTPVSKEGTSRTLKANCSSQEWCGHTFSQLALTGNDYSWQLHSYFEKESGQDKKLDAELLEDELWNRIRINPAHLPLGRHSLLPGLFWQRLAHIELQEEDAVMTLSEAKDFFIKDSSVQLYTIQYPTAQRTLKIYFQPSFPHQILGWQETYPDGFGANKKMLTTKALLKKTIWLDYWKHNRLADSTYTDTLHLTP
jgi:hypothetical protein